MLEVENYTNDIIMFTNHEWWRDNADHAFNKGDDEKKQSIM